MWFSNHLPSLSNTNLPLPLCRIAPKVPVHLGLHLWFPTTNFDMTYIYSQWVLLLFHALQIILQLTSLHWHFYNSITTVLLYHLLVSAKCCIIKAIWKIARNNNQQNGRDFLSVIHGWVCRDLLLAQQRVLVGCSNLSHWFAWE